MATAGQGRATRSRSDLRLRDRVKVDTPDVSTHGDGEDKSLREEDSVNGNGPCVNRLAGGNEEEEESDSKDEGEDDEQTDEEAGENGDNEDNEEEESDSRDEANENPVDADMEGGDREDFDRRTVTWPSKWVDCITGTAV